MKFRLVLVVIAMLLLPSIKMFAQQATSEASTPDASQIVAYWVAYWAKPKVVLFGPPEEDFNSNVHEVLFPNNVYDAPENADALDENAQWLKDHANDHFYIEGYASSKGEPRFNNLRLSAQRADSIKQALISKGVPESQDGLGRRMGTDISNLCRTRRRDAGAKTGSSASSTRRANS